MIVLYPGNKCTYGTCIVYRSESDEAFTGKSLKHRRIQFVVGWMLFGTPHTMVKVYLLICLLSLVTIPNTVVGTFLGRRNHNAILNLYSNKNENYHSNKNGDALLVSSLICSNNGDNNNVILKLRGGGDENDYESSLEETDTEEEEEEEDDTSLTAMDIGTSTLKLLGKVTFEIVSAIHRAVTAGMTTLTTDDDDEESSIITKLMKTLSNMMTAALDTSYSVTKQVDGKENDDNDDDDASTILIGDARTALLHQYKITQKDDTSTSDSSPIYQSSSFRDVLSMTRSKARLLVVVVPNNQPQKSKKQNELDQMVMKSFLSSKVSKLAEQSSRKKKKNKKKSTTDTTTTGSFLLYTPSSLSISKFTKLCKGIQKPSNSNSPLLLVIYPAQVRTYI